MPTNRDRIMADLNSRSKLRVLRSSSHRSRRFTGRAGMLTTVICGGVKSSEWIGLRSGLTGHRGKDTPGPVYGKKDLQ